ncbi:cobaltochelatase subunit CobN [Pulveribacter sp.]|uniref:cobaltochelatase subunit CobN n=1 Tax=Pulveribacter sp. TaxID=2678893 RepID=UPI0028ACFF13|nr:cobaltochelatase subunit CobN [Pulveribacter sp.]
MTTNNKLRWLRLCAALLLLLAGTARAASVLFIATGNVPQGKFHQLAEIARSHGISVEVRYLNSLPADVDAGLWQGRDAVFFDSYLQDQVKGRLVRALPALAVPHAWLYDQRPAWGGGLPEPVAHRLIGYYASGGRQNYEGFFATLAAQLAGGNALAAAPDPVVFPKTGVYHPRLAGLVTADALAYLRGQGAQPGAPGRRPVVAIALHQQYIGSMQTAFIDDLAARIEAGGAVALPFYTPMMGEGGFAQVLQPGGPGTPVVADVLVNTQIMLNAEERREEFQRLGIPVIQAMTYRRGDAADWAASPQGVPVMDVPFYLAQAEYAGVTDIQVASAVRKGDEQIVPIAPQAAAVAAKALNLARLQRTPNADKRVAVMFWNYPAGEKNLSASFLNVPRSLQSTLSAMSAAGYRTEVPDETHLITLLQRLLAPAYRGGELQPLLRDGLAALLPVADYRAWIASLPQPTQDALRTAWGEPEQSPWVIRQNGQAYFVIPRLQLGQVTLLPQPGRSGMAPGSSDARAREKEIYHSTTELPPHHYLATYLWTRQGSDALVHFGTHGTQEWLPGKERGLSVHDAPLLALGDIPVAYPYIADNIGEATQAKRRGRATIVSHQTPPFTPGGLHDALTQMHDLLHQWQAHDEGAVRSAIAADLLAAAKKERVIADMGWTEARARQAFSAFVGELHNHLHELAQTAQPQGLHTLGRPPEELHRLGTVLLMLGKGFWEAAAQHAGVPAADLDEALVGPWDRLAQSAPYQLLQRHVVAAEPLDGLPEALQESLQQARQAYANLGAQDELRGLLAVLDGRYLPTSYGGDPIKNPDAYPTGRNLYGFDPSRVPTRQAWEAGKQAAENLLAEHRRLRGRQPAKLTFSLWSVETMRHFGMLEAQALWLLGVEPVWDAGGRVTGVKLVTREELGRPRVDVVLSATGLYRDHFPNVMKQLAQAVLLAARAADEGDNPVAANARRIARKLVAQGVDAQAAELAGATRIFASESGRYGTGLDDATLATDTWKGKEEGDRKLARLYLSKMQFAYGPDEAQWGQAGAGTEAGRGVNLYAEHLSGTEGAVLSRSSNLYGMLTTDDPFQYLGGIALAVRHLDGKAPELYISNLRGAGSGRVEGAAQFLAKELATRQFHPGYIQGLMKEGYAGTLQVLDATNNFWGWTATAREIVRDDQWQEMVDVYVRDKHQLGLKKWFEANNPHALAQTMERMLEAARQGYWQADAATVRELKSRWRDLAERFDVRSDNARFAAFVGQGAADAAQAGYGLQAPQAAAAPSQPVQQAAGAAAEPAPLPPAPPVVTGMRLAKVEPSAPQPFNPATALFALALAGIGGMGAWQQRRRDRFFHSPAN